MENHISLPSARQVALTIDELRTRPTVTVEEAGAVLGLSRSSTYALTRSGDIPTIRLGRRIVIPAQALVRMLEPEHPAASA